MKDVARESAIGWRGVYVLHLIRGARKQLKQRCPPTLNLDVVEATLDVSEAYVYISRTWVVIWGALAACFGAAGAVILAALLVWRLQR